MDNPQYPPQGPIPPQGAYGQQPAPQPQAYPPQYGQYGGQPAAYDPYAQQGQPAPYPPAAPAAPVPAPSQATYSPQAQQPAQYGLRVVDSLTANEFRLEINGQVVSGVFSVHGLCAFSLKVDEAGKPVGINYPPLVITKMVQQDPSLPFNAWVREAVQARGTVLPTREIAIVALDEGAETRRWVYRNAWIAEVNFSDFDTASEYLVEEKITLRHNGVEEIWPQR